MSDANYIEDKKLIFATLDAHDGDLDELYTSRNKHAQEIEVLKVKAGIWGFVAGAVPVALALLLKAFEVGTP